MKRIGKMRLNQLGKEWIWIRETDTSIAHALCRISDKFWALCGYSWDEGYIRELRPKNKCEICIRMVVLEEFCS